MNDDYGLWPLVVLNSMILIVFALSFTRPKTRQEWTAMGAFSAFIVALFTEMYGLPLTVYLLSGWLGNRFPALTATHAGGHLWNDLIGWKWDPHLSPFHFASYALIGFGIWLIVTAWGVLWRVRRSGRLAATGPYASVRHPQYVGFLLVMAGFLLQWPTIPTLLMFPILVWVYRRLSLSEERVVRAEFGSAWDAYAKRTPRFVPRIQTPAAQRGVGHDHCQLERKEDGR